MDIRGTCRCTESAECSAKCHIAGGFIDGRGATPGGRGRVQRHFLGTVHRRVHDLGRRKCLTQPKDKKREHWKTHEACGPCALESQWFRLIHCSHSITCKRSVRRGQFHDALPPGNRLVAV